MSIEASRKTSGMCLSEILLSLWFDGNEAVVELLQDQGSLAACSLFTAPLSLSFESKGKNNIVIFYSTDIMYIYCSYHSEKGMEQCSVYTSQIALSLMKPYIDIRQIDALYM